MDNKGTTNLAREALNQEVAEARKRILELEQQLAAATSVRTRELKALQQALVFAQLDLLNRVDEANFEAVVAIQYGAQARSKLAAIVERYGLSNEDRRRVIELRVAHGTTLDKLGVLIGQGFALAEIDTLFETRSVFASGRQPGEFPPSIALLATFARTFVDIATDEGLATAVALAAEATGESAGLALWRVIRAANTFGFQYLEAACDFLALDRNERENPEPEYEATEEQS